ncbi:hypothetical protein TNIN_417981 [Trichonephila inaurata madagascariensis]|uniref:Uncharacterized protein n=1 Tax=Trichonephila inaurata madagascariensis TaxID=2747483 RepID=A0A8X7CD71_9ARAC|nr:hypothetical protein TNIN_417981 [Trichonephila inaurata madagascariensis]
MDVWRRHVVFWGKNISWKYGFNLKRDMDAQAGKMEDVVSGRVVSRMRAVGGNVSGVGCIRCFLKGCFYINIILGNLITTSSTAL